MQDRVKELKMKYNERKERYTSLYGKAFKTDKNGTLYFADTRCSRCGGIGGCDQWAYTGWNCYRCGGSGLDPKPDTVKLYVPEYEAKLDARRQAREAKRQEERKAKSEETKRQWLIDNGWNAEGFVYLFLGDTYSIKEDIKAVGGSFNRIMGWFIDHEVEGFEMLKVSKEEILYETIDYRYDYIHDAPIDKMKKEAEKNNGIESITSEFQGNINERLKNLELTITFETTFAGKSYSYWDDGTKYFYSMKDKNGNVYTWTTTTPMAEKGQGDKVVIDGTVKEHKEYKGEKQTVLTRCRIK